MSSSEPERRDASGSTVCPDCSGQLEVAGPVPLMPRPGATPGAPGQALAGSQAQVAVRCLDCGAYYNATLTLRSVTAEDLRP